MITKKVILSTLILHFLVPEINNLSAQPNFSMSEMLKSMSWRAIGPANMGGRVTDIDGVPVTRPLFTLVVPTGVYLKLQMVG